MMIAFTIGKGGMGKRAIQQGRIFRQVHCTGVQLVYPSRSEVLNGS
jgi:hypothetical protein